MFELKKEGALKAPEMKNAAFAAFLTLKPDFTLCLRCFRSVELFFFRRTGQSCDAGTAALNDGGHFVKVTGTHFLLMRHE
jgi:hypothetical protein